MIDKNVTAKYCRDTCIDELDLPVRFINALLMEKIETVGDLMEMSEEKLSCIRGIGSRSMKLLKEIREQVDSPEGDEVRKNISIQKGYRELLGRVFENYDTSLLFVKELRGSLLDFEQKIEKRAYFEKKFKEAEQGFQKRTNDLIGTIEKQKIEISRLKKVIDFYNIIQQIETLELPVEITDKFKARNHNYISQIATRDREYFSKYLGFTEEETNKIIYKLKHVKVVLPFGP